MSHKKNDNSTPKKQTPQDNDLQNAHHFFAIELNKATWQLIETPERSPEQNNEMINAAHGSLYHWQKPGTPLHLQRGYWLLARVYVVLKMPTQAQHYALLCHQYTLNFPTLMHPFDIGYAYEIMYRLHVLLGNTSEANTYYKNAIAQTSKIDNEKDRQIYEVDLKAVL